jgi:HTH-type transcriptional regulator, transcriptional repressor of NAD biosynthesis genes
VIIISYSKPEFAGCEASMQALWLAELFPTTRRLVVTDQFLRERTGGQGQFIAVPANDAPDAVLREFCGFLCETYLGSEVEAVFTSEDYGDGFAEHLTRRFRARRPHAATVEHVCVLGHRGARYLRAEGSLRAQVERIVVYLEVPQQ